MYRNRCGYPCLGLGHVQQEAEPAVLAAGEAAAPPGRRQSDNNQYKMLPGPLYFIYPHNTPSIPVIKKK